MISTSAMMVHYWINKIVNRTTNALLRSISTTEIFKPKYVDFDVPENPLELYLCDEIWNISPQIVNKVNCLLFPHLSIKQKDKSSEIENPGYGWTHVLSTYLWCITGLMMKAVLSLLLLKAQYIVYLHFSSFLPPLFRDVAFLKSSIHCCLSISNISLAWHNWLHESSVWLPPTCSKRIKVINEPLGFLPKFSSLNPPVPNIYQSLSSVEDMFAMMIPEISKYNPLQCFTFWKRTKPHFTILHLPNKILLSSHDNVLPCHKNSYMWCDPRSSSVIKAESINLCPSIANSSFFVGIFSISLFFFN